MQTCKSKLILIVTAIGANLLNWSYIIQFLRLMVKQLIMLINGLILVTLYPVILMIKPILCSDVMLWLARLIMYYVILVNWIILWNSDYLILIVLVYMVVYYGTWVTPTLNRFVVHGDVVYVVFLVFPILPIVHFGSPIM